MDGLVQAGEGVFNAGENICKYWVTNKSSWRLDTENHADCKGKKQLHKAMVHTGAPGHSWKTWLGNEPSAVSRTNTEKPTKHLSRLRGTKLTHAITRYTRRAFCMLR